MGKVGRLRHELELQTFTTTLDPYNNDIEGYTATCDVWGSINPLTGKEYAIASTINASINYKITIRNMIGITDSIKATNRFRDKSSNKVFNVSHALNRFEKMDDYIDVYCTLDENPNTDV